MKPCVFDDGYTRVIYCGRAWIKYLRRNGIWVLWNYRLGTVPGPVGKLPR